MDARELEQHTLHQFDAVLNELRKKVLLTGGMVEEQLQAAVSAMMQGDSAQAEQVIERDRRINELELVVDEDCTLVLTRRSPVASALRLVFAVVKSITDLERMGDEAARIARMAVTSAERGVARQYEGLSGSEASSTPIASQAAPLGHSTHAPATAPSDASIDPAGGPP